MFRSTSLSNMCPIISCPLVRAQESRPTISRWFVPRVGWSPFVGGRGIIWRGGWVRRTPVVGCLGGWLGASVGKPPKAGGFPPIPLPHFAPDLTFRTRPGTTITTPSTVTTPQHRTTPNDERNPAYHIRRAGLERNHGRTKTRTTRPTGTQPGVPHPNDPTGLNATSAYHIRRTEPERNPGRTKSEGLAGLEGAPESPTRPAPNPVAARHSSLERTKPPIPTNSATDPRRNRTTEPPTR